MDWVPLIPSIVMGGLAGLFIARSRTLKIRHRDDKRLWEREQEIIRLERDALNRSLTEYREAYEDLRLRTKTGQSYQQMPGVTGMQTISPDTFSDDMMLKMLTNLNVQPKQHIIQEEP